MPFEIVRNDITKLATDAIVNTANPLVTVGSGVDSAIHRAAGPELLEARRSIGEMKPGEAAITPAFKLSSKYVIHTVGPVWQGGDFDEAKTLRSCYDKSLSLAFDNGCKSIAFPMISTGTYGFPKDLALQTAISSFSSFLTNHDMMIILVVFDKTAFALSEKLMTSVASYIDENYIADKRTEEYGSVSNWESRHERTRRRIDSLSSRSEWSCLGRPEEPVNTTAGNCNIPDMVPDKAMIGKVSENVIESPNAVNAINSLDDLIKTADIGFSGMLLKLIDAKGKTDPEVYKKANIDRKLFSKIRNNPDYRPKKSTALALAVALELNLDETTDLISRAGYALTKSSTFDIIVEYFIKNKEFNIFEINATLFEYDQPLLC